MSSITPEVRDYMRQVKDVINNVKRSTSWHGFSDVERQLGLDQLVDDQTVTVTFTVPADSQETARSAVSEQVNRYSAYLPDGWNVSVS